MLPTITSSGCRMVSLLARVRVALRHHFGGCFFACFGLVMAGCMDAEYEVVINPDGTGKVHITSVVPLDNEAFFMGRQEGAKKDPERLARDWVRGVIDQTEGAVVWRDVTSRVDDEGKLHFSGTAYFSQLDDLKLVFGNRGSVDMLSPGWTREGSLGILTMDASDDDSESEPETDSTPQDLRRYKAQLASMLPIMTMFLMDQTLVYRFVLPGEVTESSNMVRIDDNTVELTFKGEKMIAYMQSLLADDDKLLALITDAGGLNAMGEFNTVPLGFYEALFGEPKLVGAEVRIEDKPQFDFKAEVKAAQEELGAMRTLLGLAPAMRTLESVDTDELLYDVYVAGVQWADYAPSHDVRPFGSTPGLSMVLLADMPLTALSVKSVQIDECLDHEGNPIFWEPARSSFQNKISSDGDTLLMTLVSKDLPEAGYDGFSSLRGSVTFVVAGDERVEDIGITTFAKESRGDKYSAEIKEIEEQSWGQSVNHTLELFLEINRDSIKEVRFYNEEGMPLANVRRSGHSSMGGQSVRLNFSRNAPFPEKGRIELVLYDELQEITFPFEVGAVDTWGRPLE
jgi:hypothetical protein